MIGLIVPTISKTTLPGAIQSLYNQSNPDWKVIVCGDSHIPDYQFLDDRVKIVGIQRKAEAGLVRNYGAHLLDTEWVGFLDDDDELYPEYVQTFYDNQKDTDVLIYKMINYGSIIPDQPIIRHGLVGISFALKREIFLDHPFDGQGAGEDYRLLYTLEKLGYKIKFLDYVGYHVRKYLED
jgi:glycosyltransferase involved in cell wall biosynthesis